MSALERVLIAGGGTGGHVFPAIAVAQAIAAAHSSARLLFVGSSDGLEASEVPAAGLDLALLHVRKLKGAGHFGKLASLASLGPAVLAAFKILRRFRPQVVVGVGGYASGPAVIAASVLRVPTLLLEQNAIPGITNRAIGKLAARIVIAFAGAADYFPAGKCEALGNPLRAQLVERLKIAAEARRKRYRRGGPRKPTLLVIGGSQGAHRLNELCVEAAPAWREQGKRLRVLHQTGEKDAPWVCEAYQRAGIEAVVEPFFRDMASLYEEANLAFCRSGATTLAELTVAGLPALLVPYPYAADDHQAANANALVRAGGALMERQEGLGSERLVRLVGDLLADGGRLREMSLSMEREGRADAAGAVVRLVERLAR